LRPPQDELNAVARLAKPTYKALEIRRSADGADWVLSRLKEDNDMHDRCPSSRTRSRAETFL